MKNVPAAKPVSHPPPPSLRLSATTTAPHQPALPDAKPVPPTPVMPDPIQRDEEEPERWDGMA